MVSSGLLQTGAAWSPPGAPSSSSPGVPAPASGRAERGLMLQEDPDDLGIDAAQLCWRGVHEAPEIAGVGLDRGRRCVAATQRSQILGRPS